MLRTNEALEKMMLRTDEALEKIREVLDRYSLSYHIQDLLTESFKLELTPSGIIVYFNESNQTWGMIDGDSGFNFLTLDGITNAIYRALWLDIFRIRQPLFYSAVRGIIGRTLVLVDTSEDGRVYTYHPDGDETDITVTVSTESMRSSDVLSITDHASKMEMDTYFDYNKQGVPSVHIDDDFYCYIVSVFYKDKVRIFKGTPSGYFTFKFNDLTVVCRLYFDSSVYKLVSIDGVEYSSKLEFSILFDLDALYTKCKALSEEINPVTDEVRGIINAIKDDLTSLLYIPLKVTIYNPAHITYLKPEIDSDYSFSLYKSEEDNAVYIVVISDVGFGDADVIISYRIIDGKPVRLLDCNSYTAIVHTFFNEIVEVFVLKREDGVFRFTFANDYADLVDIVARVDYETGVYTVLSVGVTPVGKEVTLRRGMLDFETLYKYCASLDRSSVSQYTSQGDKKDTLSACNLQVVTHNDEPIFVQAVGTDYIYNMSVEKASQLGLPVLRLTDKVEAENYRGMLLSPVEIERRVFAEDITDSEVLCKSVIDSFWA